MTGGGKREKLAAELTRQKLARVRRRRLRRWWLQARPFIAMSAALVAFALGIWGFRRTGVSASADWSDSVYRAVRLFGLQGGELPKPSWQLQVARLLAPLVVGYAAVAGLLALYREQAQLLRLRVLARRHVVVAGLGRRGFQLARALNDADIQVVVVERDRANSSLAGCRQRGIPVVIGDATDPEVLSRAGAEAAVHIVACCDRDATNLDVLAACAALSDDPGWIPASVHVLVEDIRLWQRLDVASINAQRGRALRIDFASLSELAAKAMVGAGSEKWLPPPGEPCHVVVDASTEIGRRVAAVAVRAASTVTSEVSVTLVGRIAEEDLATLRRDAPWLERVATTRALVGDPCQGGWPGHADLKDVAVVFICHRDEASGLAEAIALAECAHPSTPVLVLVNDERLPDSLITADLDLGAVQAVGATRLVLGPNILLDTALEALARARHEAYVRHEGKAGRLDPANPSLVSWDKLPESLKESNRRFADSVGRKVEQLGSRIVPFHPQMSGPTQQTLPEDLVEELAKEEHDRWVSDLVADGWRPGTGPKDPTRKLHPLLIPWSELSGAERDKDRDSIRALPALLAAAGYTIARARNSVLDRSEAADVAVRRRA